MKRILIISPVLLAVIVGGWYLFWGHSIQVRIDRTEKRIQAEQKKLRTYHEALTRFEDRIREYSRLHSAIETEMKSFSGKDEVIALYKTLDSMCSQPGYRLGEITPSVEEVIQFLREWARADSTITVPIRIKAEADFRLLAQLVRAIEENECFNGLASCSVRGSDELYPECSIDMTIIAGLGNRMEMFDFE
jgi:hypothetical protein